VSRTSPSERLDAAHATARPLDERRHEFRRLAWPSSSLGDDVLAAQQHQEGLGLNPRRLAAT
jgi:hypothetical protein